MPVGVGYNSLYNGDIHAVPTGRYDTSIPRRTGDSHHRPATTTITTYNVTKDPVARSNSVRDYSRNNRHRSSTLDTSSVKPIIVTTNHSRPHNSSSHTSSSTSRRPESPSRDLYRSSEENFYSQPASSIRSRSHQRHHSATYDQDEIYRMRERMGGDDRPRAPARPHSRQSMYVNQPRASGTDFVTDDYEYTKPGDLARYDLDHDRPRSRAGRRDSFDRGAYYRPSVSVVANDIVSRPERRAPPTSGALDRYNRQAAAGIYERGSVAMPALPATPAAPPVDLARRSSLLDTTAGPAIDRRTSRPRPISLYQDPAPRMDDLPYRPHDEGLHRDRRDRDRDDPYRDDAITTRGFGIRPELLEQSEHRRPIEPERPDRREMIEDHRSRRDYDTREPKRRSDEELDKSRGRHERRPSEVRDRPARVEESRDRKDGKGEKMRDKVVAGLGVAAAAIGLGGAAKEKEKDEKDVKVSPRRRRDSELPEPEPIGSRAADRYKPREADIERRSSPREDPIVVEQRREATKERHDRRDESITRDRDRDRERERERDRDRDREKEREREKERDREKEREKERQREKERERERERDRERERAPDRERERNRRDAEAKLAGGKAEARDNSPHSDDSANGPSRRRPRPSSAFNPTDTKGLMDLKAELAAIDHEKPKEKERPVARGRTEADTTASSASERQAAVNRDLDRARDESRGREMALMDAEQKQVRVVSPPRDKSDSKPIKGILKQPTSQFPEDNNPIREGVAPHKDDKTKKDVPSGARWTKINRRMVNPEALTIGKERFEVRDDAVIVLRVLSKEEIQAYATATAQLREMRRKEFERGQGSPDSDRGRERDEEDQKKRHRHRRERDEEDAREREREVERERDHARRHRRDDDDEKPRALEYDDHSRHHHHPRSHRERDLETIASSSDPRRPRTMPSNDRRRRRRCRRARFSGPPWWWFPSPSSYGNYSIQQLATGPGGYTNMVLDQGSFAVQIRLSGRLDTVARCLEWDVVIVAEVGTASEAFYGWQNLWRGLAKGMGFDLARALSVSTASLQRKHHKTYVLE
ncbi:hypothetical protein SCUP234_04768 [Seiridium cupressi]